MDVNTHTDEMFLFLWPVWVCAELRTIAAQRHAEDRTEFRSMLLFWCKKKKKKMYQRVWELLSYYLQLFILLY